MASQIVTIGLAFGETGKILRLRLHMPTVSGPTGYPRRHAYSYLLTETRPERRCSDPSRTSRAAAPIFHQDDSLCASANQGN
jgi:hypothetical protein